MADEGQANQLRFGRWLPWTGLGLSMAGIIDTIYLTSAHYAEKVTLACPHIGVLNCQKVTTSSYSMLFGVPLAVLGLLFFVTMLPLQLPAAWRSNWRWLRLGRLAIASSGVLMIFWLIYVELFRLNAICPYCTVVHILTAALFGLTAYGTALTAD